jgi:hypothetical protein
MSTIDNAKALINYQPANKRPACNNCAYVDEQAGISVTYWCDRSRFKTSALAVCNQHHKRQQIPA